MRRRYNRHRKRHTPVTCLLMAFGFVCLCLLSFKLLFFLLAVTLIALGVYLLCGNN